MLRNSTAGIEKGKGVDGVLVGFHVDAVQFGELLARFLLAVEELHDGHAADVLLQESVDPGDGGANAAVGVAHVIAEEIGEQNHERQRRKRGQRQTRCKVEQEDGHAERAGRNR